MANEDVRFAHLRRGQRAMPMNSSTRISNQIIKNKGWTMKSYLATIMLMIFSAVYASSAVADDTLKVVSYNVQVRPVLDDAGKLPEIGKRITDFDIVGIQELFVGAERLKNAAGGMNFRYFAPRRHIFKIVNSG